MPDYCYYDRLACWSKIRWRQPLVQQQRLLQHYLVTVLSVIPGENLPGRSTYYSTSAPWMRRYWDL